MRNNFLILFRSYCQYNMCFRGGPDVESFVCFLHAWVSVICVIVLMFFTLRDVHWPMGAVGHGDCWCRFQSKFSMQTPKFCKGSIRSIQNCNRYVEIRIIGFIELNFWLKEFCWLYKIYKIDQKLQCALDLSVLLLEIFDWRTFAGYINCTYNINNTAIKA